MNEIKKCLMCKKPTNTCRGLCPTHYAATLIYVKNGIITWEKLETDGKTIPAKHTKGALKKYLGI